MRRGRWMKICMGAAVTLAAVLVGLLLTFPGVATWDSENHYRASVWLVHQFGHAAEPGFPVDPGLKWYGPIWALFLGIMSEVALPFLADPSWIRHGLTCALFPLTLALTWRLLVRGGVRRGTAAFAAAFLFGTIRLGGHALLNVVEVLRDTKHRDARRIAMLGMPVDESSCVLARYPAKRSGLDLEVPP